MSLYSQMESIPGPSSLADEPVQRELKSLLRQLNWSYVALWTFNYQTRFPSSSTPHQQTPT
jgi:hypothetical protein